MKKVVLIICGSIVLTLVAVTISYSQRLWFLTELISKPPIVSELISDGKSKTDFINLPNPSIDSIFSENHTWTATLSAEKITKILVTGDVLPARSVNAGVVARNNPLWPYEKVSEFINSLNADITFVNLETPLLNECPVTNEGMIFCGTSRSIEGLQAIGADIVGVANNHTGNHGTEGLKETVEHIRNAGMIPVGIEGPIYKVTKGTKFAFLAYNDIEKLNNGLDLAEESVISAHIDSAKKNADVVIVQFHWGAEYQAQPDKRQIYLAHFVIDQGADLVVSNHPHWIQPIEIYKGKVIMYAHGNFIFDQMWSEKTREGVLGLYTFYGTNLIDIEFFPLKIYDYGQAVFMGGSEKRKVIDEIRKESYLLQSGL